MISFENCEVRVNGTGILATSASLSSDTRVMPIRALGFMRPYSYSYEGVAQSSLSLSYFMEPAKEPFFSYLNFIKNLNSSDQDYQFEISIGQVTGRYYLSSYQINAVEHEPIQVNASLISFHPTSGILTAKSNSTNHNITNSSGIAHYYSTALCVSKPYVGNALEYRALPTINLINCSYSFSANWIPVTIVGESEAVEVKYGGAEEIVEVTHDVYSGFNTVDFSPETALNLTPVPGFEGSDYEIVFFPISGVLDRNPSVFISKGIVRSSVLNNDVGQYSKSKTVISRYY